MAELPPELAPPSGTQAPQATDAGPAESFRDQLAPLNPGDPASNFLMELISIGDELGILDDSFGQPSVQDQADLQDADADPFELLSRDQLTRLVTLFLQIPEPERSKIANTLRQELPPQVAQRLEGIVRFVQGRDAQQEIRAQ